MDIRREQREGHLELHFAGRLDGYWAQHLAASVAEVLREGTHHVRLNLSETAYISSAGIGILVDLYKQFQAVKGSFAIADPSRQVRNVLDMVGLAAMLSGAGAPTETPAEPQPQSRRIESGGILFEVYDAPASPLTCRLLGTPDRLSAAGFQESDCRIVSLPSGRLLIGLGALGDTYAACRDRFGEFLGIAGAGACQPTDGTNFPDYMLASGSFVPRMSALYGLSTDGPLDTLVRFETAPDPAPLSRIVETCLEIAGAPAAAIVIMAESAGLMGASLKRPPVRDAAGDKSPLFGYPGVRTWLSFSPERCFPRSIALLGGIASAAPADPLRPFLRPLRHGSHISGHFHAAAFGYRPLQKGRLEMQPAVRGLFEAGGLQAVLHILSDDREAGGGESELLRGACWIGPIRDVTNQETQL